MNVNVHLTVKVVIRINPRIKINALAKKIIFGILLHEVMKMVHMWKTVLAIQ